MAARREQRGFDVHALTRMIGDANDDEPGPILPWSLMDDLARLIPAEEVSICDLDLVNREREMEQNVHADNPRLLQQGEPEPGAFDVFWRHYPSHWAGLPPSGAGQVRCWSDRYPGRMLLQQPLYREFVTALDRRYFLSVGLVAPTAGRIVRST